MIYFLKSIFYSLFLTFFAGVFYFIVGEIYMRLFKVREKGWDGMYVLTIEILSVIFTFLFIILYFI
jgi:hypothetical protein